MPMLDRAVQDALGLDTAQTTVSPHGGSGFSSTFKITTPERAYFMKTGRGDAARVMFEGAPPVPPHPPPTLTRAQASTRP